jgi:hypothetical protein
MQEPHTYNSVAGTCPACRQLVKLQLLPVGAVRCPKCDVTWPSIERFVEVFGQTVGDPANVARALRNSARASGW